MSRHAASGSRIHRTPGRPQHRPRPLRGPLHCVPIAVKDLAYCVRIDSDPWNVERAAAEVVAGLEGLNYVRSAQALCSPSSSVRSNFVGVEFFAFDLFDE